MPVEVSIASLPLGSKRKRSFNAALDDRIPALQDTTEVTSILNPPGSYLKTRGVVCRKSIEYGGDALYGSDTEYSSEEEGEGVPVNSGRPRNFYQMLTEVRSATPSYASKLYNRCESCRVSLLRSRWDIDHLI